MYKPPNILVRGLRGKGVPPGYILGRVGRGPGLVQLLKPQQMQQLGIATAGSVAAATAGAGFGVFVGGLPAAHVLLGIAQYPHEVTFEADLDGNAWSATGPATGSPEFTFVVGGVTVGGATFTGALGAVSWVGGQYILAANTSMQVFTPAVQDATLATVNGLVTGFRSG